MKAAAAGKFAKERFFYNVEPAQRSLRTFSIDYVVLRFLDTRIWNLFAIAFLCLIKVYDG